MKDFFKEIFEYHHHYNQLLIREIILHRPKLTERTFPLFCHVLNAHQIWNSRILGTKAFGVFDIHTATECARIDKDNLNNTLKILDTCDPGQIIDYRNSKGIAFSSAVRDILFHVANHSTHHKGQIISDFRQQGIDPLVTDYIYYKME